MDLVAPGFSWAEAIFAALFVAIGAWEHARPAQRPSASAAGRWRVNLSLFAIRKLLAFVPALVATTALLPLPFALLPDAQTPSGRLAHGIVALLALDLAYYLVHRAMHSLGLLWRLHQIHHSDLDLDLTTSLRGHPLEALLTGLALAGAAMLTAATPAEIAIYGSLAAGVQLLAHANVALPPAFADRLATFLVTPDFHHMHHSRDAHEGNAHFGAVLTLWDRMFGTALPATRRPRSYGVADLIAPRFQTLGTILLQPLAPQRR